MQKSKSLNNQKSCQNRCLSNYRLNRIEDLAELRKRVGNELYLRVWEKVKLNLNSLAPRQVFNFQKYIPECELETFVKQSCYFITMHPDFEFLDDYSAIRRTY